MLRLYIHFNTGDTSQTHTITINQDNSCEVEFFLTTVVLISGIQPIEAFQPLATVFIDDGIDEICGNETCIITLYWDGADARITQYILKATN